MQPNDAWLAKYLRPLVGRKIVEAGTTTEGFPYFKLDNGAIIEVSRDPEGNGPGFLFGLDYPES